jgi:hypothetical protein
MTGPTTSEVFPTDGGRVIFEALRWYWQVNCSAIADKRAFNSLATTLFALILFLVYLTKMSVAHAIRIYVQMVETMWKEYVVVQLCQSEVHLLASFLHFLVLPFFLSFYFAPFFLPAMMIQVNGWKQINVNYKVLSA